VIKYHGTPLTPIDAMIRAFKGRHAMVSFEHPEQIGEACERCQSIVLDNGAFSAWKKGESHDFEGYVAWATHWLKHPAVDWCVIPDVIDGSEEDNDALLRDWPLRKELSVPVYHFHESLDRLERLAASYARIALGSSGEFREPNTPVWWSRMSQIMDVCCDSDGMPLVKLHGLRMLDTGIFSRVPLASADSTNVARNIGLDIRWKEGMYLPKSKLSKAIILMENIEAHTAAHRWNGNGAGYQQNMELLG
jgi:hypothetical protein